MISAETSQIVIQRANMKCENPSCNKRGEEIHHIYTKNEYNKNDRDDDWNLCFLCQDCHTQGEKATHARNLNQTINHVLIAYLKALADKRKPKEERSKEKSKDIIQAKKQRRKQYLKNKKKVKQIKEGTYSRPKPVVHFSDIPF